MSKLVVAGKQVDFINQDSHIMIDSRDIAKVYEKRHGDVLRAIDNHIKTLKRIGEYESLNSYDALLRHREFTHKLRDGGEVKKRYYLLNRDMFNIVVLKFKGDKAMKFTVQFIKAFNAMEQIIKDELLKTKEDYKYYKKKYPDISKYAEVSEINKKHGRVTYISPHYRSNPRNLLSRLVGLEKRLLTRLFEAKTRLFSTWTIKTIETRLLRVRESIDKLNSPAHKELISVKQKLITNKGDKIK